MRDRLRLRTLFRSQGLTSPLDLPGLYAWFDGTDASTITLNGTTVSRWDDKSGNGYFGEQSVAAEQPLYDAANGRVTYDLSNDELTLNGSPSDYGVPPASGWLVLGTETGTVAYQMNMGTSWRLGPRLISSGLPGTSIYQHVFVEGTLTESEREELIDWVVSKGATQGAYSGVTDMSQWWRGWIELTEMPVVDTSSATNLTNAWLNCNSLTSFPVIDVSSCTVFGGAWRSCSGLTSFPALNYSTVNNLNFVATWRFCNSLTSFPVCNITKGTNFTQAWDGCTSLANFPSNMFDGCTATLFNAFANTNLTTTSIDNILVSIESNGTSNGTFVQSGGNAPSATGEAAIDALRTRGWSVTVTGGY